MVVPSHAHLFTIDINSLYTNINSTLGLQAVQTVFSRYPDRSRPDQEILQLLSLCLNNNDFNFNNQQYLQVSGTAMGHRYAPSYANIYMSEWEREALPKCTHQPLFFFRFLDDIIGIWTHSSQHFQDFINTLNNHHPSITVTHTINQNEINFLDTTVYFHPISPTQKIMRTKVYFKSTDTHALLHKHSYHPKHTFQGIVKSQIIRFHRISSTLQDFQTATRTLFNSLRHRGYSKRFLRTVKNSTLASLAPIHSTQQVTTHTYPHTTHTHLTDNNSTAPSPGRNQNHPTASSTPRIHHTATQDPQPDPPHLENGTRTPSNTQDTQLIPLISTFFHKTTPLLRTIRKNFQTIQPRHPPLHNHNIISVYRRNKNLRDILVHSAIPTHTQTSGEQKYYRTRKFIHNPYTKKENPIHHSLSLSSSNLVYRITCTICHKHYIGETKHPLLTRLRQQLYNIRTGRLTTALVTHFQTHSPDNLIITGLESQQHWTTAQRKRSEKIWIFKLGTITPSVLNDINPRNSNTSNTSTNTQETSTLPHPQVSPGVSLNPTTSGP